MTKEQILLQLSMFLHDTEAKVFNHPRPDIEALQRTIAFLKDRYPNESHARTSPRTNQDMVTAFTYEYDVSQSYQLDDPLYIKRSHPETPVMLTNSRSSIGELLAGRVCAPLPTAEEPALTFELWVPGN